MLNERETILALEEAMRGNRRFWERQGYDEREAFIKTLDEIAEITTDPSSPYGEKLDVKAKEKFLYYERMNLGL